jgi:arsenate reductase (thioredoxin)
MSPEKRKKILFVCIGNSCRSQMAEAFARTYGSDVLVAASAGLMPANCIAPDTQLAMQEKNIAMDDYFPKHFRQMARESFDLVVNISGMSLEPSPTQDVIEWDVADPVRLSFERHCEIRDEIERLVMNLVLALRRRSGGAGTARGV